MTAETTAPRLSLKELLEGASGIKADITPEQQKAVREASKVGRLAGLREAMGQGLHSWEC